ncbi:MAG: cation:proton antiporter [Desulfosarcinaceae bacterium]
MNVWSFLLEMVMLLAGAFALGALAQRLRQSPIVGYLLAGTIIGPLLFNAEVVNQSAELGVSLLLFSIGLEFSLKKMRQMGRMAFGGGTVQVLITMAGVASLCLFFTDLPQALALGAISALSSTAVVMRVLVDRSEIDSVRGRSCLSLLLLQDMAIVPLVLMVSLLAPAGGQTHIGLYILKILASAAGLGGACYLLLFILVPRLLFSRGLFANRELTVLLAIAIGLGASWAAHALGISPALGAFMAGILLGESPFATQIRADIGALRTIMVTLFFASVGMLVKPMWFALHMHWILAAALSIFGFKALVTFGVGRLFGLNGRHALATGITLAQIGEFSFVLAAAAQAGGLFDETLFDLIVSVIILLMFSAPYMVAGAFPLTDRLMSLVAGKSSVPDTVADQGEEKTANAVLVVGFGPSGRQVVDHLLENRLAPTVIDVNPASRATGGSMGVAVHLGDACNEEILRHAGLEKICMAVITVPDPVTAARIVELLRRLRPELAIAVRCRYNRHLEEMKSAGADIVVDEETVVGHLLAHEIIAFMHETSGTGLACRLAGKPEPQIASPPESAA